MSKPPRFAHQEEVMPKLMQREAFALWWEQGCAKTRPIIEEAEERWKMRCIDALLVVGTGEAAPNWYTEELPNWMSPELHRASAIHLWDTSKAGTKRHQRAVDEMIRHRNGLRILCMSYDAVMTDRGRDAAWELLRGRRCMMVIDECADIKGVDTKRSIRIVKMGVHALIRRALEGTPVTQGPFDLWPVGNYLDPGFWARCGFGSFAAFKAHFGVIQVMQQGPNGYEPMMPPNEEGLVKVYQEDGSVVMRHANAAGQVGWSPRDARRFEMVKGYRRLDELQKLFEQLGDRRLKEDCLDLPPKLYEKAYFDLSEEQAALYQRMEKQSLVWLASGAPCPQCSGTGWDWFQMGEERLKCECGGCGGLGKIDTRTATAELPIVRELRLQQIACGYVPVDDFGLDADGNPPEPLYIIPGPNPRLETLRRLIERHGHRKAILWGQYKFDIDLMMGLCREMGHYAVQYDGRIGQQERIEARNEFQRGRAQFVVASSAMSRSVTMHAAWWMVYYTNSPKLRFRLQSEDRAHRAGLDHPLTIWELIARGTVDEKRLKQLREKRAVAERVQGDKTREWI
jgi:SNF2 family DNA or RNA helicase